MVCSSCKSEMVLTSGPGRVARFAGVTLRVPNEMDLWRCPSCGIAHPTAKQTQELHQVVERDLIGYDGRGMPVLSGT